MRNAVADGLIRKALKAKTPRISRWDGLLIKIEKGVYPVGEESRWLVQEMLKGHLGDFKNSRVLDYGTGTGMGIAAAKLGAHVTALDISGAALRCAKRNALLNDSSAKIEFRQSNGIEKLKDDEEFDYILANLPFDKGEPRLPMDFAVYDRRFKMRRDLKNLLLRQSSPCVAYLGYSHRAAKQYDLARFFLPLPCKLLNKRVLYNDMYILYKIDNKKEELV